MKYYITVIKKYATFKGRARRKEYWMFVLFNLIFAITATILDNIIGDTFKNPATGVSIGYGYIYLLYVLFALIPGLAVLVRRLHDVGKSGKLLLAVVIAAILMSMAVAFLAINGGGRIFIAAILMLFFLGIGIWFLVLVCTDSVPGANKYGPNPKGIGNIDEFDFMSMPDGNS